MNHGVHLFMKMCTKYNGILFNSGVLPVNSCTLCKIYTVLCPRVITCPVIFKHDDGYVTHSSLIIIGTFINQKVSLIVSSLES